MVRAQPEPIAAEQGALWIASAARPKKKRPERKSPSPLVRPERGCLHRGQIGVSLAVRETPSRCLQGVKEAFTLHVSPGRPSRREMNRMSDVSDTDRPEPFRSPRCSVQF